MDLRSSEYKAGNRFIKPTAVKVIAAILLLLFPFGLFYGLNLYAASVESKNNLLQGKISDLTLAADPLIIMSAETEQIQVRANLEKKLHFLKAPWSYYLQELQSSAPQELAVETIIISPDRNIDIRGSSATMQTAARYKQNIESLSFMKKAELTTVTMNTSGRYDFQISALLVSEEGVDQDQ